MSLAFAPAQPFTIPDQPPTLEADGIDALLAELAHGSATLRHELPWADPAGPTIVLDGDDDDDDDDEDEDDDFFEDEEDEEWEDEDYEEDDFEDDDDDEFEDDFEDDEEL